MARTGNWNLHMYSYPELRGELKSWSLYPSTYAEDGIPNGGVNIHFAWTGKKGKEHYFEIGIPLEELVSMLNEVINDCLNDA